MWLWQWTQFFFIGCHGLRGRSCRHFGCGNCWLQQQVSKKNVSIQPVQMDFENDLLAKEKYQVVLCFNYLERSLFPALKDALLQGGLLFFETVYRDDVTILASAMNPRYVLDYNELLHAFSDLRILEYREKIIYAADLGKRKPWPAWWHEKLTSC